MGDYRFSVATAGRRANRKTPLPPYQWRLMPGRPFIRRDGGPWVERASFIDHDDRTITLSGALDSFGLAAAAVLAMRRLEGCPVAVPPLGWKAVALG